MLSSWKSLQTQSPVCGRNGTDFATLQVQPIERANYINQSVAGKARTFPATRVVFPSMAEPEELERRRQVRGLVWLALAAMGFAIARAVARGGVHSVFPHGWWRVW